ncbi:hypothetical protein HYV11_02025 [Candidatus Dependentiae bacterium]|nr:hypothetical protein [Candidatus Dependentiae bacterium]
MNKNYYLIGSFLLASSMMQAIAQYVRQVSMFSQEEIINEISFSHTVMSDNGKMKEEFFINGIPVQQEEFYKEFEGAQLKDLRKEREKKQERKKSQMQVIDQAQLAIIEKLIITRLQEIQKQLDLLHHEQLKKYYVYQKNNIDSLQKLSDIIQFVTTDVPVQVKELVAQQDMQNLQKILTTIEPLPDHLEQFFKNSIQNAIKNCDDTVVLKELLTMLSQ